MVGVVVLDPWPLEPVLDEKRLGALLTVAGSSHRLISALKFMPAYATTVPTAQGSEDPAVVIPLVTQHYSMLRRNLVYTAVIRGQRLVVVVGQPKALAIAVRGAQAQRRWSKPGKWLGGEGATAQRPAPGVAVDTS